MDTQEVIVRFEQERQALALMDHPNIAKVLDAGATPLGRPFFVMELVRGIRITNFCDQNNLSTDARLDLVIADCHAIQHAHQKGIIHCDIKPSNILVHLARWRACAEGRRLWGRQSNPVPAAYGPDFLYPDRSRRYDMANGLAADLKRHLNNEPIIARPPSKAYRFQKAWRRNKLVFTAAAAVAIALLVGISLSNSQAFEAIWARDADDEKKRP